MKYRVHLGKIQLHYFIFLNTNFYIKEKKFRFCIFLVNLINTRSPKSGNYFIKKYPIIYVHNYY